MKKYEVVLRMAAEAYSPEFKKIVIESKNSPKIIAGRLIFYDKGEEITIFNQEEWIYWRKI